jgi:hypothetical protein
MILKKDIKIVKEFLGTTDVKGIISPFKCIRVYIKGQGISDNGDVNYKNIIMVVTPTMYDYNDTLEFYIGAASASGVELKIVEHQVGRNFVRSLQEK